MYNKKRRRGLIASLYVLVCVSTLLGPAQPVIGYRISEDTSPVKNSSWPDLAPLSQEAEHASLQTNAITIQNSNLTGNKDYGLHSNITINAENNWWGDANGPTHANNPQGRGDAVSDNVDFAPWLTSAVNIGIPYSPPPEPGVITLLQNSFEDNASYGVQSSIPLPAENNWWGHPSGPYHPTLNPDGQGDNVSDNVDFDPWLTTPPAPPATFSISGHVRDDSSDPIPDVTISAEAGGSATTDATGAYTISGLPAGTYTLTPSKSGYTFSPATRTVSVPPDATGRDFIGISGLPPCDPNKQPVLLIHGWGGPDVMADDKGGLAQLSKWMLADGYVEGCNLFYATGVRAENRRRENCIAIQSNLRAAYDSLIDEGSPNYNPNWGGHFDIIGHSYGGLNARFYLESPLYAEDASSGHYGIHVDNLFTLGSPHGGVSILGEAYPVAARIAWSHVFQPRNLYDFLSAAQLFSTQMDIYNIAHSQPDGVCYRLIGGDFLQQPNVPDLVRIVYSPWSLSPNDIAVSQRSSLQLGRSPLLWLKGYRNIATYPNIDMHGYAEPMTLPVVGEIDLSGLRSYVSPILTYNEIIAPNLGASIGQCRLSQADTRSAVDTQSEELTIPPLLINSGAITGGQTIAGAITVDWGGQTAFYVTWMSGGDLDLALRDPAGAVFTPTIAISDPNADYGKLTFSASGLATYIFTNTLTGTWTYTLTATIGPYPIPFDLYVNPDSPLVARAYAPEWQSLGTPAVITASLFYSTTPVSGATVQARVARPDGSESSISLRDDGLPPDNAASDGIYSGTYTDTTEGGFYYVLVEADGTYASQTYHRTAQTVFPVASYSATLNGRYADQPKDDNGDGLYEYLDVDIGMNATQQGDFTVAAALQGEGGRYIDLADTTVYSFTGTTTLTLRFDGQAIRASGLDGPYIVTEVLLLDDADLIKLDEADNVWVTPPYDHRQFGVWPDRLYLPLIVRNY